MKDHILSTSSDKTIEKLKQPEFCQVCGEYKDFLVCDCANEEEEEDE